MVPVKRYSWGFIALGVLPYVLAGLVALSAVGGAWFKGRKSGAESREPEIVELRLAAERLRLAALAAQAKAEEAAQKVRIVYRDRIVTVTKESEAAKELVEEVVNDHQASNADCTLPPSLRLLWNRTSPDGDKAQPASGANDAPVTVAELAEGVRQAQDAFERNKEKLAAVQNYLAQIQDAK